MTDAAANGGAGSGGADTPVLPNVATTMRQDSTGRRQRQARQDLKNVVVGVTLVLLTLLCTDLFSVIHKLVNHRISRPPSRSRRFAVELVHTGAACLDGARTALCGTKAVLGKRVRAIFLAPRAAA